MPIRLCYPAQISVEERRLGVHVFVVKGAATGRYDSLPFRADNYEHRARLAALSYIAGKTKSWLIIQGIP